ncbi:MAG: NUDIX domain-containing protein [Bacteroidota bacterium]
MKSQKELKEFIQVGHRTHIPNISIDCTIFGYHERKLKVLLLNWKTLEGWSLPGGRVLRSEALQQSATRILFERTGLNEIFLNQFHTFGDSAFRLKRFEYTQALSKFNIDFGEDNWLLDRTLSIGFYALVEYSLVNPQPDIFTEECRWWDVHEVPDLLFDHNEMIEKAFRTLQQEIYYQPVGYNLLPGKFTLPEIHDLYETILEKKLDRRNFPKKLISSGIIKKLKEQKNIGPHRSPFLYKFDKRNYEKALKEGLSLSL